VLNITKEDPTFSDFHHLLEEPNKRKRGKPTRRGGSARKSAPEEGQNEELRTPGKPAGTAKTAPNERAETGVRGGYTYLISK